MGGTTLSRSRIPEQFPRLIADRRSSRDRLLPAADTVFAALREYHTAWDAIAAQVEQRIAADDRVAAIDAVSNALSSREDIDLLNRYSRVLEETLALIRSVERAGQVEQESLLKSRGREVKEIYAMLNPGADVGFDMMEPANDAMKLHASSFGVRMPAAANLSECQLNCLGLAVWLMRATTPTSPFGFMLLDDPVQAMDDDHTEAFVTQMIPHLLDGCGKQVIVLSHVKGIVDRLRQLSQGRKVRHYHIESYASDGPTIVHQIRLNRALAEIKGGMTGNEDNRKSAVAGLRVLIEEFVRELHLKALGTTPGIKLDTATSGQLADLFRTIPGTDPAEYIKLKDTIGFCDPAHHTQSGYAVPVASNIRPHVDRVENVMKKYGLI